MVINIPISCAAASRKQGRMSNPITPAGADDLSWHAQTLEPHFEPELILQGVVGKGRVNASREKHAKVRE